MKTICIFLLALFSCFSSSSLLADATITGVVTSQSSGNPISGASIALIKGSQNVVATTTTVLDGSYTFLGVNPGQYSVRASAAGFETQILGAKASNNQTTTVDFQLLSNPGTISGQVVDSVSLLPINGATILVSQNNFLIDRTTSDVNGEYTVNGLDPGSYTVVALASGYQTELEGAIVQGGQTTVLNFSLDPNPGSVSGTVTAANMGLPITGAIVEIIFDNQVVESTQTNALGNYTFSSLSPGLYDVLAHANNFQAQEISVVAQSNQTSIVNFSLETLPGTLSGNVTDANTSMAIKGAAISIFSNNHLIDEALTDSSGNYMIDDLPPGSYIVEADGKNHQMQLLPVTILSNQTTTLDFALHPDPSTVQGQITNALTGQPIRGAFVQLFQNDSFETVRFTDNYGNYIMATLSAGNYSLMIAARGFYTQTVPFSIGTAQVITVNVALIPNSPPRNLSGMVVNNRFLLQIDRIHHLQWDSSQDPTVLFYQVFRNGLLIATISANAPLEYDDHRRSAKVADYYLVNDINASRNESSSASITLR
ncbi:MAG TPA: carboxypeptidase-like regulatory domain-containing protein [Chlamydiales bacterium]|nr:carboxypeptidase-like regulatory domain-containing protein [Chlamydiales bacterium]